MTGKYSVYTLYEGHEIMFHVSTLLPFSRDNRQQVRTILCHFWVDLRSLFSCSILFFCVIFRFMCWLFDWYRWMRSNQVERKRHIGNDIVNIVFIEGDLSEFSPSCIKSQFTRILFKEQIKSPKNIVVYGEGNWSINCVFISLTRT